MTRPGPLRRVRLLPLVAAFTLAILPLASASGGGLSLTGPSHLTLDATARVPIHARLALDGVVCTRDTQVPVELVASAEGARAVLGGTTLLLPLPAPGALARPWTGEARTHLAVAPADARGFVDVLARWQLPAECRALDGPASGEARHTLRVARASHDEGLPALAIFDRVAPDADVPTSVLGAFVATGLLGLIVLAKRLRARLPA